ncbi:MAG: ATP-binding region ATPase domain protein [Firmicutes bacterium]|nr:ATP-binding region ATPase domain protein [Bacillota bacterium]
MRIRTRLIIYYISATLLLMLAVGEAILIGIEHNSMKTVEKQLVEQSDSAVVYINQILLLDKSGVSGLLTNADSITTNLSAGNREVRIYDQKGKLLSAAIDGRVQNIQREDIKQYSNILKPALNNHFSYIIHDNKMYFASPIELQGSVVGVLEFVYSLDMLNTLLTSTRKIMMSGALLFMLLIALLTIFISNRIVKPIEELSEATNRYASRDFTPIEWKQQDELGSLVRNFNAMGEELQDYIKRQKQFVANVSHELRTPLTAIRGYAQYLSEEVDSRPDIDKAVYHLNNESARLQRLVDQLLLLSRLDNQKDTVTLAAIDWGQLVQESLDKMRLSAQKYKVRFKAEIEKDVFVLGDAEKLIQVIMNLLDNAVKFSPTNEWVAVNLRSEGEHAVLNIEDHGTGVAEEDLNKVFERFYRGANTHSTGGTGLGLAISREIIIAHHGAIKLFNLEQGGTVVKVSIPLAN